MEEIVVFSWVLGFVVCVYVLVVKYNKNLNNKDQCIVFVRDNRFLNHVVIGYNADTTIDRYPSMSSNGSLSNFIFFILMLSITFNIVYY